MRLRSILLIAVCAVAATFYLIRARHSSDIQHDPLLNHGYTASMLVQDADATHRAVESGDWSSPATWSGGVVPGDDATVLIPADIVVRLDGEFPQPVYWVLVKGALNYATNVSTLLTTDTLFVDPGGSFTMGTPQQPIDPGVVARLSIKAYHGQPIDRVWDWFMLSRGAVFESPITVTGAYKSRWHSVTLPPDIGAMALELDEAPTNWTAGDEIVLTNGVYGQDERFIVTSVVGSTVNIDQPVTYARSFPASPVPLALHVGNLTTNARIESHISGVGNAELQGHMILLGGGHQIRNAGIYHLGRTQSFPAVTDPIILTDGTRDDQLFPACKGPVPNVRGRYAVHFHQAGPFSAQSIIHDSVILTQRGTKNKIGVVNHSSNVSARRNVSLNFDGSHFFTEVGNEVGDFTDNLAIYSSGSQGVSEDLESEPCFKNNYPEIFARRLNNLGHRGHGFWLAGGGVVVEGNVSVSQGNSNFALVGQSIEAQLPRGTRTRFPVSLLREPAWAVALGLTDIPVHAVPFVFKKNVAYAVEEGKNDRNAAFEVSSFGIGNAADFPTSPKGVIDGFIGWGTVNGAGTQYGGWTVWKNITLIHGSRFPPSPTDRQPQKGVGMALAPQGGNNVDVENANVIGFKANCISAAKQMTATNVFCNGEPYAVPVP